MDEQRPGAPRKITDDAVEDVVTRTLESIPRDATHWSTRSMAKTCKDSVRRIWHASSLRPHRSETFKLSTDPLFIEKVRDVVGLYMNPPDHAVAHDYERQGTTSLFAALDLATGKVIGECRPRHRSEEFRKLLNTIDREVPKDLDVHVILDNYGTHKTPSIQRWVARHPRFHFHFIPTSSSWLNLVERWFADLTMKKIRRGVHRSVKELVAAAMSYIDANNEDPKAFIWTKTADQILGSVRRLCARISAPGHSTRAPSSAGAHGLLHSALTAPGRPVTEGETP